MTQLTQLTQQVQQLHATVSDSFGTISLETLNYKPGADSWSMLECLEHLNRYSRYYNPALMKAIAANSSGSSSSMQDIGYSWLGKKSLDMVRPQNMKKYKTVKHMNPVNSRLGYETVEEFLSHQKELLTLMANAGNANLNKKAIPVEFFKLLKMRIGETLEFVVLHEERHVEQAKRVLQQALKQAA